MADEGVLTFVVDSGMFILGNLVGSNKLNKPRVFQIIQNPDYDSTKPAEGENSKTLIQLSPLPGTPPYLNVGSGVSRYPVPLKVWNKIITELYARVTNPAVDPG
jgi:hypothetical protein